MRRESAAKVNNKKDVPAKAKTVVAKAPRKPRESNSIGSTVDQVFSNTAHLVKALRIFTKHLVFRSSVEALATAGA